MSYRVVAVLRDRVRILAPKTKPSLFTRAQWRKTITAVLAANLERRR